MLVHFGREFLWTWTKQSSDDIKDLNIDAWRCKKRVADVKFGFSGLKATIQSSEEGHRAFFGGYIDWVI
jgi:hypothetical protein